MQRGRVGENLRKQVSTKGREIISARRASGAMCHVRVAASIATLHSAFGNR